MCAAEHPAEPTPAELVRSVLAAARSLTLRTGGHRVDLVGLHALPAPDRLLLTVPAESRPAEEIAATPAGTLAAAVEFTDVAPVAVPDRVRARVRLGGRLSRDGEDPSAYRFVTASAVLEHDVRPRRGGRPAAFPPDPRPRLPSSLPPVNPIRPPSVSHG